MKSRGKSPRELTKNGDGQAAIKIEIRVSENHFRDYRRLVDSDWNGKAFVEVLRLLWDVVALPAVGGTEPTNCLNALKKNPGRSSAPMPEEWRNSFRVLRGFFHRPDFPSKTATPEPKKSRLVMQAEATIISLLLQFFCDLTGNTGFFRDLQSLLYLNTVHHLLPKLKEARAKEASAIAAYENTINALELHSVLMWWNEPSHMFYLRAAMMGQIGRPQERLECLEQAFSATPVSDHSYMTKANAYWGELLEAGDKKKALRWLVHLSRNVPESYALEVADMIAETAGAVAGHI